MIKKAVLRVKPMGKSTHKTHNISTKKMKTKNKNIWKNYSCPVLMPSASKNVLGLFQNLKTLQYEKCCALHSHLTGGRAKNLDISK